MEFAKYGILFIIIICFITAIIILINPFNLFEVDENIPLIFIGISVTFTILLVLMEKPSKDGDNLKKADNSARIFIFENYRYFDLPLINHDIQKDIRGRQVYLLEYKLKSSLVLSLHVDTKSGEVVRCQKQLSHTPLPDNPTEKNDPPVKRRNDK